MLTLNLCSYREQINMLTLNIRTTKVVCIPSIVKMWEDGAGGLVRRKSLGITHSETYKVFLCMTGDVLKHR